MLTCLTLFTYIVLTVFASAPPTHPSPLLAFAVCLAPTLSRALTEATQCSIDETEERKNKSGSSPMGVGLSVKRMLKRNRLSGQAGKLIAIYPSS
ncbi:hypothetical protein T265_03297 [Opisthorchis viverrini]|uniref:Secreted protein n=1 Tax=Opisthorchis viverrini TaxID=6198 RepID=A0A074ZWH9_OPIVI|nr:hypothetical protein T265_03297 [Opisthorchis viverrini]KER30242.1 hypothetical protein T265_03297 [Opisthorchis viverrini]